ncbi:DUF3693 domain-containing protein [Pseudoalteromonas sp.]|uniref:DUF3693 domain-containing protein n=1 Tax=Pseudoalteromonas sp. TaxID=53249 RepID=UPI003564FA75
MNFSYELIEKYKNFKGYTQDKQVVADVEKMHKGLMSEIKSGKKHLTADQVIFLANAIGMERNEALVKLSLERAKSKEEKKVWEDVVKKISAACAIVGLCIGLAAEPESQEAFN